ncbi:hypothetical protein OEZ85_014318 [Tetradesmus obliquus]|uniref:Uncharacterized protein n=1 Tax=Tetradesmus obliquus TaxID=3088 RepID=A0ABY8U8R4_TETOB|nr:hypothetical protein OEZ85_014318 [Tetradesmus obliquus]
MRTTLGRKLKAKKQSSDDGGGYARAEITSEQLENLAHDMEGSKRPETERKYDSQYARYLWHCEHLEDGSARDPPYNPDMSLPDGQAKITSFMMWVGENYPGWEAPNKAKQIGLGTVKQARGMVKLYWALHHLKAGLSAGDMGGAYTSAASGAEAKSLPDKGARPDRDPQCWSAPARRRSCWGAASWRTLQTARAELLGLAAALVPRTCGRYQQKRTHCLSAEMGFTYYAGGMLLLGLPPLHAVAA